MPGTSCQTASGWNPIGGGIAEGKLRQYLEASNYDPALASEMFYLDGAVAAAFLEPIRLVELVLREAIHQRATQVYGSRWMLNPAVIDGRSFEKVTRSIRRVGNATSSDKIVSDLNLGFWSGLFQRGGPGSIDPGIQIKHISTLWIPALNGLFKGGSPSRKTVATLSLRISYLRNRMAHHEPILFGITQPGGRKDNMQIKQQPMNAYRDLVQLGGYLDSGLGELLSVKFSLGKILSDDLSQRALRHAKSHQNLYWI